MKAYVGILEKETGTLWGIWFPDLPGCISASETAEGVIAQVGDAVEQWLDCVRADGEEVPPARTIEDLRGVPEVADALRKGDTPILVTVPEQLLGLEEEAIRAVDRKAAERGLTRLAFLRATVLEKLAG